MRGPTIYAQLLDARLEGPRRELRESVERFVRNGGLESLVDHYAEALKAAYVAGVSDGFAQGIGESDRTVNTQEAGAACICYPGHHDMPGGREPACPAP